MAFTVAPTSGEPPYLLSADIDGSEFIDGVHYSASVRSSAGVGSCPALGEAAPIPQARLNELINNGSTITTFDVLPGNCRTYTLEIFRVSDGSSVASSNAYVDNIE